MVYVELVGVSCFYVMERGAKIEQCLICIELSMQLM